MNELLQHSGAAIAALIAAATSFILGVLTHSRAREVHTDEVEVDHAKMIQQAYQEILDELREELSRRNKVEMELRGRLNSLQSRLDEEIEFSKGLERQLQDLREVFDKEPDDDEEKHE